MTPPATTHGRARRIDAHHHVWDLAVRDQPWTAEFPPLRRSFAMDELLPQLARAGVEGTVVVQTVDVPDETPDLLALSQVHPEIRGVVGWVDLTAADVADRLASLRDVPGGDKLVGVRHQVQAEADPSWLIRDDVLRGLRAVAEAGLVFDLLVRPHQLPTAIEAVRRTPHGSFVLDHLGKPAIAAAGLEPWAGLVRELATRDNVACKLSGMVTEASPDWSLADLAPYAAHVLSVFGPARVMAGSDWPVCLLRAGYADVWTANEELVASLAEPERDAVLGGTAATWYGLS